MLSTVMDLTRTRIDWSLHGLGIEIDQLEKEAVRFDSVDEWLLQRYAERINQLIDHSQSNRSTQADYR